MSVDTTSQAPLFTAVIPCYNHGAFLRGCIQSVEAVKEPCEIIIVDDGSQDVETIEELKKLAAEGYTVIHQENAGPGAARNNGIARAVGRYIIPLDADDRIRSSYVEKAREVFETTDADVIYADFQRFGGRTDVEKYYPFNLQRLLISNNVGACAIYRKTMWEKVGGYDAQLHKGFAWEDWDLWLNMARHGAKFHYLNMVGYDYYYQTASRERSFLKYKNQVNGTIEMFESKYPDFYRPALLHEQIVAQVRKQPLGMIGKILLAAFFPKAYARQVAKGKIRKYLF